MLVPFFVYDRKSLKRIVNICSKVIGVKKGVWLILQSLNYKKSYHHFVHTRSCTSRRICFTELRKMFYYTYMQNRHLKSFEPSAQLLHLLNRK